MSERKRPILMPQYMKQFHCIGSACEDSCCVGWRVDIDHDTYKKYQEVRDEELAPLLDKNVTRNRSASKSEASYAKVKLVADSRCPFLDEEMLCKIQKKYGEGHLSDVCTTYPRTTHLINGVLERSATMSCPEAARRALLNPEPMEFDEEEEPSAKRNIIKTTIDTHELKLKLKPQKYLWELRIFTIMVLQERKYFLWERLTIIGMFFAKVRELIEGEKASEIPELIASYQRLAEDDSFKKMLQDIPAHNTLQMVLLKEIADKRFFDGINSARFLECFKEFLTGIQYTAESTMEEIGNRYNQAWQEYYDPFMKEHEYILENYLVNYVFKNLFPFTGEKALFDAYMMLVLHYALIKMSLIGMAAFHKGLTEELVIRLIQSFAKTVEHNQQFLNKIAELMKKNSYNTMAWMAILIKN